MTGHLLDSSKSQLLIIDVQERLVPAMDAPDAIKSMCTFLAQTAAALKVPIILTEQYPSGLGATIPSVAEAAAKAPRIEKTAFSAGKVAKCVDRLRKRRSEQGRTQIVLCGVEAHVCVLQTALDLSDLGFDVFVVADAVMSRTQTSRDIALSRMAHAGLQLVTCEMVAFEWVGDAQARAFKAISAEVRTLVQPEL